MELIATKKGVSLYEIKGLNYYTIISGTTRKTFNTWSIAVDYFLTATKDLQ